MKKETENCSNCISLCHGIFNAVGQEPLEDISDHKISNVFKKGQTLFMQGNPPFGMYCIKSGIIKITQVGTDGKESIVRLAKAGDTIGHRSLFSEQVYQATATAITDAKVCFYDKKYIQKLVKTEPSVSYNLISKLGRDLGDAEHRLSSFTQKNVRERLAELLLTLQEEFGTQVSDTDTRIRLDIKLTREEMASIVGTASETLIRFITEFKAEKLIEQEGKVIFLLNTDKLIEFAG